MSDTATLYSDGGLALASPSRVGGSWAWLLVEDDRVLRQASGFFRPGDFGVAAVSSNVAELVAAVRALESAPPSWRGTLVTDSQTTLRRLTAKGHPHLGGPHGTLRRRLVAVRDRFPKLQVALVSGHPTADELRAGRSRRGKSVSPWNVRADLLCQAEVGRLLKQERLI